MTFSELKQNLTNLRQFFESSDYETVTKLVDLAEKKSLLPKDPTLAIECKEKGNKFFKSGNFKKALEFYSLAIENDHVNAVYYSNRAAAYGKLKMRAEGIKDCNSAIKIDPNFVKPYLRLGDFYTPFNSAKAVEAFEKALALEPGNQRAKVALESLKSKREARCEPEKAGEGPMPDLSELLKNPEIMNMAKEFMKDKSPEDLKKMGEMFKR